MDVACEICGKKTIVQRLDAEDGNIVLRGLDGWSYCVVRHEHDGTSPELFVFSCSESCRANLWRPVEKRAG
jgi:hypothetical protein